MNNIDSYTIFMQGVFAKTLKAQGVSTYDLCKFVNSLMGAENFLRNHPIPVKKYFDRHQPWVHKREVDIEELCSLKSTPNCTLKDIETDVSQVIHIKNITSFDIIENEYLWNKYIAYEHKHDRHSSDDCNYYTTSKTGWTYLAQNPNVVLDMSLILFLEKKNVPILLEEVSLGVCGNYGEAVVKESCNGLKLFKKCKISYDCISSIINDPIRWEGILYNQEFCNESILDYIRYFIPITQWGELNFSKMI